LPGGISDTFESHTDIIESYQQGTAYIQGWLWKLKNDKRFIISAASQAQKATDYILNVKIEAE